MRTAAIRDDVPMVDVEDLRERHERLQVRLREIAGSHGHDPDRLRIVAVTKTHPIEVVETARSAGIRLLGESRVQEAEPKIDAVPEAEWHFIGRLQSNKARRAVRGFAAIHSIDSLELLERVDELAAEERVDARGVLLQVNVSGEASKAGLPPDALTAVDRPADRGAGRADDDRADGRLRRGGAGRLRSAARRCGTSSSSASAARCPSCRWA